MVKVAYWRKPAGAPTNHRFTCSSAKTFDFSYPRKARDLNKHLKNSFQEYWRHRNCGRLFWSTFSVSTFSIVYITQSSARERESTWAGFINTPPVERSSTAPRPRRAPRASVLCHYLRDLGPRAPCDKHSPFWSGNGRDAASPEFPAPHRAAPPARSCGTRRAPPWKWTSSSRIGSSADPLSEGRCRRPRLHHSRPPRSARRFWRKEGRSLPRSVVATAQLSSPLVAAPGRRRRRHAGTPTIDEN